MANVAPEKKSHFDISVIIPVYNEEEGLDACVQNVQKVLTSSGYSYEIIFIDDGSTDGSLKKMLQFASVNPRISVIQQKRNYGQQKALFVGLAKSSGRAVITYDADLQFAPDCIPKLAEEIFKGADIASGIRQKRQDSFLVNKIPSYVGKHLINRALKVKQTDIGAVKAYSRLLVTELMSFSYDFLVIPAAAYTLTKNFVEIPVEHRSRKIGCSKWSMLSRLETYFDIYVSYAQRPFQLFMILGFWSLGFSFFLGCSIIFYRLFFSAKFAGTIIFFDVFLFLFGLHFLVLAMIGEFVVRTFRRHVGNYEDMVLKEFINKIE